MLRRPSCSTLFPYTTLFRSLRIQMVRIEAAYLHGRVALAAAAKTRDETLIAHAAADAERIRNEKMDWSTPLALDRKSTRLNSSHLGISYAVFCLKKKKRKIH